MNDLQSPIDESMFLSNFERQLMNNSNFSPNKTVPMNLANSTISGDARGTMTNFYFQQDKAKMEAAAERLIHSVNAVTNLLKANTELRDNIERLQKEVDDKDAEGF